MKVEERNDVVAIALSLLISLGSNFFRFRFGAADSSVLCASSFQWISSQCTSWKQDASLWNWAILHACLGATIKKENGNGAYGGCSPHRIEWLWIWSDHAIGWRLSEIDEISLILFTNFHSFDQFHVVLQHTPHRTAPHRTRLKWPNLLAFKSKSYATTEPNMYQRLSSRC